MKQHFFKAGKGSGGVNAKKSLKAKHPLEGVIFSGVVRDVATNGQAVLQHSSGVAVFVRGAWVGEVITVKITAFKKRFAQGQLLSVEQPSEHRIEPFCAHFMTVDKPSVPSCGSCAWQFITYHAQLAQKQQWVKFAIEHLKGAVNKNALQAIIPSVKTTAYRNRAEFKSDGHILGFNAVQSDALVDIKACPLLNHTTAEHLVALRNYLPNDQWQSQKRNGKKSYSLLAVDDDMPIEALVVNQRRPFKQGNSEQNNVLKNWLQSVLTQEGITQKQKVLELFAGSGNFTRVIAQQGFEQIIAAEVVAKAVDDLNNLTLTGVQAHVADLFDESALSSFCQQHCDAKILVLDPPRDGLVCIEPLLKHKGFERIAYISCDLATCMRDVQAFMTKGYSLISVMPVDLFPQTPHVELCVLLVRNR